MNKSGSMWKTLGGEKENKLVVVGLSPPRSRQHAPCTSTCKRKPHFVSLLGSVASLVRDALRLWFAGVCGKLWRITASAADTHLASGALWARSSLWRAGRLRCSQACSRVQQSSVRSSLRSWARIVHVWLTLPVRELPWTRDKSLPSCSFCKGFAGRMKHSLGWCA